MKRISHRFSSKPPPRDANLRSAPPAANDSDSASHVNSAPAPAKKRVPRKDLVAIPAPPSPDVDPVGYLKSIQAVRERCKEVFAQAQIAPNGNLRHFVVDWAAEERLTDALIMIIKRDFEKAGYDTIPPHGRWQHLEAGGEPRLERITAPNPATDIDEKEITRRLIDLFVVSVLLDAGAGNEWSYFSSESNGKYNRSEGLAVASFEMFVQGAFSSDGKWQVDVQGLRQIDAASLAKSLQVSKKNPIDGLEGRASLLNRLAGALEAHPQFFGTEPPRPGNMLDYLMSHELTKKDDPYTIVPLPVLWDVLIKGFGPVWPENGRQKIDGKSLGDAWRLPTDHWSTPASGPWIVPFHKLSQWMCYSLMVPMTRQMGIYFAGEELMTGLPEYRNGGLLIDFGLLRLKDEDDKVGLDRAFKDAKARGITLLEPQPMFNVDDPQVVEWRALTVGFLDWMRTKVNAKLGYELTLAQFLEAASWKLGREVAALSRPIGRGPPIVIESDGTVF